MRINCSDEEDYPGQFGLFQGNCRRSLRSKRGQAELRELEAALLALPEKRLIHGGLQDSDGGVCAIAAYGQRKGIDLSKFDNDYDSDEVGIAAGMPRLVAWSVVFQNDMNADFEYVKVIGPAPNEHVYREGGCGLMRVAVTPERRYEMVLEWVREQLVAATR